MNKKLYLIPLVALTCIFSTSMSKSVVTFQEGEIVLGYEEYLNLEEKLSLHINDNVKIKNIQNYNFNNEYCYFVDLINEKENEYSVIINRNLKDFTLYIIYNDDSSNYINKESLFNSADNDLLSLSSVSSSTTDYSNLGATFDNDVLSPSKYFSISNISSKLSVYSSSYLNEVKLLNVPNYMNTMFDNQGCVPTTAAMYFAYLEDNGYSSICGGRNLPVSHIENYSSVNSFITYLGNNYFKTTDEGTLRTRVPGGYDDYLDDVGYGSYYTEVSKNYIEFYNSIYNCGLPVPISMEVNSTNFTYGLAVLGIGTKSIYDGSKNTYYIYANSVSDDAMEEFAFNVSILRQFYFIHR